MNAKTLDQIAKLVEQGERLISGNLLNGGNEMPASNKYVSEVVQNLRDILKAIPEEKKALEVVAEALEEVKQGAIRIDRQDSRITNYSLRKVDKALKVMEAENIYLSDKS